jgi:hypothetical protein
MAKIPQYQATKKLPDYGPGVQGNVAAAGVEWGGLQKFGQVATQAGLDMLQRMREAREAHEYSTAKTAASKAFNQFELDIARDPEYQAYNDKFGKHATTLKEQTLKGITEPKAREAFTEWYDQKATDHAFVIQKLAQRKEIEHMQAGLYENLEEATKQGDVKLIDELLAGAVAGGIMSADKAALEQTKRRAQSEIYQASARIIENPEVAIAEINNKELYPHIDEKTRFELIRRAEIEQARRDRIADKEKIKRYDAQDRDFLARLGEDTLTRGEVLEAIKNDSLSLEDGRFYLSALEKETSLETDPDIYVQHRTDIFEGEKEPHDILQEIKESYSLNYLTKTDFNTLVGHLDTARGKGDGRIIKDPYYKRGVDYLKSQIQPRRSMFAGESSEEANYLMLATLELDRRIEQAEKQGKPLDGNEIVRTAMEIAPLYTPSMAEKIRRQNEKLKEETEGLRRIRENKEREAEQNERYRKVAEEVLRSEGLLINEKTINIVVEQLKNLGDIGEITVEE